MKNEEGTTLLNYTCRSSDLDKVKFLIENGADPSIKDKHNKDALAEAIRYDNTNVINHLISHSEINQHHLNALFLLACKEGSKDRAKSLLN
jgi:ankyrin repeat protein